MLNLN